MNRIDRVTAILIQLQSKKIVKAQDIADRFNISLRTVYRDIKTLEEAGVPVIGEAGMGYSIMDGYRLPPVMFTKDEATAFLTAEKLIEKFTDASTETSYKSAMYKVRAVLRSTEKDMLENIEEHIEVLRKVMPFNDSSVNNTLPTILKSISEKRVLNIQYAAFYSDEITKRDIEPIGIFYSNGYWHIIAFCQLRDDYRDFRTDRILRIYSTDKTFDKEHPSLKSYLEQMSEKQELQTIVINVDTYAAKYLGVQKYYYGFVKEERTNDCVQMTFLSPFNDGFERWLITFADHAEVVIPDSLKTKLKELVSNIHQKISW
ncbi:MAG TPA: YafY family protein [Chitinophagaceae bacterium]|nr:YafY family protein [Chitinophagaceae bacterium]